MANLAQQIREELTERAKNSESCKEHMLEWVMNEFRAGSNPVIIKCTNSAFVNDVSKELRDKFKSEYKVLPDYFDISYNNGKHYAKMSGYNDKQIDITDLPDAQRYACNGQDESDKTLFLQNEGFHVMKHWRYGTGNILEITY